MKIDAKITITYVDSAIDKKLDELISIVKGQQVDAAQIAELTKRLNDQSDELKKAAVDTVFHESNPPLKGK